MEYDASIVVSSHNVSPQQQPNSRVMRKGLIVWLLPMAAVFSLAWVSGAKKYPQHPAPPRS